MCFSNRRVLIAGLFGLGVLFVGDVARAEDTLDAILASWAKYRDEMRSVSYEADGVVIVPKDAFKRDGHVFAEDQRHPCSGRWLIDFSQNEFRIEVDAPLFNISNKAFSPRHDIFVYANGELRRHQASVTEHRGDVFSKNQPEFHFHKADYPVLTMTTIQPLLAHGYVAKGFFADPGESRQGIGAIERKDVAVRGSGLVDGDECLVLRAEAAAGSGASWFEVWAETGPLHRVRRVRVGGEQHVHEQLDLSYGFDGEATAVHGWTYVRNSSDGTPSKIIEMTVRAFRRNPPIRATDFSLNPEAGMVVRNESSSEFYSLGPKGEHVPLSKSTDMRSGAGVWYVVAILIAVATVSAGCFYLLRRRAT
ncbi:MAG: hypothetical protein HYS13_10100 [Planctomycetia bacterium]|nr:hypothetical protein [Planctomycetia bacterium]